MLSMRCPTGARLIIALAQAAGWKVFKWPLPSRSSRDLLATISQRLRTLSGSGTSVAEKTGPHDVPLSDVSPQVVICPQPAR